MTVTLGIVFRPQLPPEELRSVALAAEGAGIGELWLWEDCFLESGPSAAAAALAWSSDLHIGVGLMPVPLRNPALVAMEIATLGRLFPGRFTAALGHGVQDWMTQVGAGVESPMTLLREHTDAVRRLLEGERVDVAGRYITLDGVALDWPPTTRPRVLIGGRGPKTVGLAGEIADGILLDAVVDLDGVRRGRGLVDDARERSERPGRAEVVVYTELDARAGASSVSARIAEVTGAGADTVIVQPSADDVDPRGLIEVLAEV